MMLIVLIAVLSSLSAFPVADNETFVDKLKDEIDEVAVFFNDTLGSCDDVYIATTEVYFSHDRPELNTEEVKQRVANVMKLFPDPEATSPNVYAPVNIFRYAAFNSLTYCTEAEYLKMPSVRNMLTAGFKSYARRELFGFKVPFLTEPDLLYDVDVHPPSRSISLSWRGTQTRQNILADTVLQLFYIKDLKERSKAFPFQTSGACSEAAIQSEKEDKFYVFKGFMDSLPDNVFEQIVLDLQGAMVQNPGYKVVIVGHSFGASMAHLTALHLTLAVPSIPIHALYTFGHPLTGSLEFHRWSSHCIGEQKIVRSVSFTDIVPWGRYRKGVNEHSPNVIENFFPDPFSPEFIQCMGMDDQRCSAQFGCADRKWTYHSDIGGFPLLSSICKMLPNVTIS